MQVYIDETAGGTEVYTCPNCSKGFPVRDFERADKPLSPPGSCDRCGCPMDAEKGHDYEEVYTAAEQKRAGAGVLARPTRKV